MSTDEPYFAALTIYDRLWNTKLFLQALLAHNNTIVELF